MQPSLRERVACRPMTKALRPLLNSTEVRSSKPGTDSCNEPSEQEIQEAADTRAAPGAARSPKCGSDASDPVAELAEKLATLSTEDRARLAKLLDPEA